MTLTIAPPANEAETRVTVNDNLKITGWELNDEVNLYIVKMGTGRNPRFESISTGVIFKCIDAAKGTFIGTLPEGAELDNYNFAVFGATAKSNNNVDLVQKTMCSTALKEVVVMAAWKSNDSYTMQVVNNVMKVKNNTGSDMEVAWYGISYGGGNPYFFTPCTQCEFESDRKTGVVSPDWKGLTISYPATLTDNNWNKASHFTLKSGVDSYINMCIMGHSQDQWSIAKEDGTKVVPMKKVDSRGDKMGKLYNAGTID